MRIDSPLMTNAIATGSFSGSFVGAFEGDITADSVAYDNITGKPTLISSSAQIGVGDGALTQNNFTNTLKSKLDAIEDSATADQTDAQIRTAVEAASDSNVFTDADHTKLNAIEASADVTDTANVTSAGALMDSEVSALALIKGLTAAQISGSGDVRFEALNAATSSYATILGSSIVSASVLSSPSQGTVRLATNGVNTDIDLGLQAADSPTFTDLTLTGNLTVTGDRIEQQVTNLAVEDQFITINSGASAQDAGIFFEGQGASLGWDESENRFALDFTGGTADQTTIAADAYIAAIATDIADANYQKDGNLFVSASGDAFIYVTN